MKAHGYYRIYKNGELVAHCPNIITIYGKNAILRFLAGNIASYAGAIGVGIDSTTTTILDKDLGFELFRVPIAYKTVDAAGSKIIFKATAGPGIAGTIHEIGLYPSVTNSVSGQYQTKTLLEFDTDEQWSNVTGLDSTNSKVGTGGIKMTAEDPVIPYIFNTSLTLDLAGYSPTDTFRIALYNHDTNCKEVQITFITAEGIAISGTFAQTEYPSLGTAGYKILSRPKSGFSNQNANWSRITGAEIRCTANSGQITNVTLDGLQIVDNDNLNPDFGLISRSIITTSGGALGSIVKEVNTTIDLEYGLVIPL